MIKGSRLGEMEADDGGVHRGTKKAMREQRLRKMEVLIISIYVHVYSTIILIEVVHADHRPVKRQHEKLRLHRGFVQETHRSDFPNGPAASELFPSGRKPTWNGGFPDSAWLLAGCTGVRRATGCLTSWVSGCQQCMEQSKAGRKTSAKLIRFACGSHWTRPHPMPECIASPSGPAMKKKGCEKRFPKNSTSSDISFHVGSSTELKRPDELPYAEMPNECSSARKI